MSKIMKPHILIIDDDPGARFGFSKYLSKVGYTVKEASSLAEARKAIIAYRFDVVILDLMLPDGNGIDWIQELRETCPDVAIVVITGAGDIPVAVEAMRRGADNFMTKPVNMEDLDVFLRKSLEIGTLRRKDLTSRRLEKKVEPYFGKSPVIREVKELALVAADSDSPTLLQGETGTGKSMLARWIHDHSHRNAAPFVEVSCSGLKGDLLASELFGHVKGAFTSAIQDRQGLIEVANGGTLFLDEIGDMDLAIQAQFLKLIEEKTYRRLGEVKVRSSDFRLICATNKDLPKETEQKRFRQDLYFRINTFPISIPSLRERLGDLEELLLHILAQLGLPDYEISPEVMEMLHNYSWPGNIRELRNVLERALILSRGATLQLSHFPGMHQVKRSLDSKEEKEAKDLKHLEEEYIRNEIKRFGGDIRKAAQALGISRATLYRKLKKFHYPL
jgi:DNA-binding NtrC family response regulator